MDMKILECPGQFEMIAIRRRQWTVREWLTGSNLRSMTNPSSERDMRIEEYQVSPYLRSLGDKQANFLAREVVRLCLTNGHNATSGHGQNRRADGRRKINPGVTYQTLVKPAPRDAEGINRGPSQGDGRWIDRRYQIVGWDGSCGHVRHRHRRGGWCCR